MKCFTPFTRPLGVVFGMAAFGVALAATPSDVARGKKLFSEKNCNVCHSVAGKGGKFALDNVGAKRDAEWLLVQLKNPKAHNPMSMMPPTQGSDQELKSLVAYLTTLKPAGASAPSPANQTPSKGRFLARPKTVGPIVTGKPVDVEFTLGDTTRTDTVTGPAPVVRAKVTARVTMPSMPGMPELKASVHAEDQPGLYGLKTTFPHGGEYLVALTVQPSTGRAETSSFTLIVGNAVPGASATGTAATGQAAAPPTQGAGSAQPSPSKGRYSLRLRLPEDGVFAEEEMDVEFFVGDTSRTDPVTGPAPVVRAQVTARFSMPAMPGMPELTPRMHEEGQPGYYGAVTHFPHGGEYLLTVTVRPRNGEPGTASIPVQVKDAVPGRKREKPYLLTVKTNPSRVQAGKPVRLTLQMRHRKEKKVVADYEVVHEMKMHLLVVSKDLRTFDHVHPELGSNGEFTMNYTFPHGGDWLLYADATPAGAGTQIISSPLKVQGAAPGQPYKLQAPKSLTGTFSGLQIAVKTPAPLQARRDIELRFNVRDAQGQPVNEFQPWLGATGHLVLISQDGETFVHSHPLDDPKTEADESRGAAPNGDITFLARFPKPGLYKGWLQTQREGKIITSDFVFEVRDAQTAKGGGS